jgi:hypothetical protein
MKTAASTTTKQVTVMSQAVARENPNPSEILALMAAWRKAYAAGTLAQWRIDRIEKIKGWEWGVERGRVTVASTDATEDAPFVHIYSVISRDYGEETETLYARVFLSGDGSGECDRELMSSVDFAPDFDPEDEDVELVIKTEVAAQEEAHEALLFDVAEYIAGEGYRIYSFIDELPGEVAEGTRKLEAFGEVSQR